MEIPKPKPPAFSQENVRVVEFSVAQSCYGVSIDQVKEIISANIMTAPVPDALPAIDGAINLRGKILPLINLAKFLHAAEEKVGRIIISEFGQGMFGFGVSDVVKLHMVSPEDISVPTDLLQAREGYVLGIAKIEGRIIYLLSLEKIARTISA
ncbi:MAG TPA: chemotaxis protein CheW [Candidatus Omnitrophota bacterium]|jgi:two-component system chemotaxis response regulator CheV|nr:chemotaxis protein CheW [Candidatus Omnitrophota bacterium]HPN57030.1 chemotaxis protein CheW [Candidatus Omnitrophota bacterium]